ncbi:MAG: DUF4038 domain-containing protein [Ignavibacteria bacterium]|nr:DUF4038 domain-containing protein [Ignavibacteria bacterium]
MAWHNIAFINHCFDTVRKLFIDIAGLYATFALVVILSSLATAQQQQWYPSRVSQWDAFEAVKTAQFAYTNPIDSVEWVATFTSPSGLSYRQIGFWDGGKVWKVRFRPNELGKWQFRVLCNKTQDENLHWVGGEFECMPGDTANPLLKHGYLKKSANNRYFTYNDGTPFFWMGDNVWAISNRATLSELEHYLKDRSQKRFNVITAQATGCYALDGEFGKNRNGESQFINDDYDFPNPAYFRLIDSMAATINQKGMLLLFNLVWTSVHSQVHRPDVTWKLLSPKQCARLARYIASRLAAYHAVWLVGADDDDKSEAEKNCIRAMALAVKESDAMNNLTSHHPRGWTTTFDSFPFDTWLDFHCVQASHDIGGLHGAYNLVAPLYYTTPVKPFFDEEAAFEDITDAFWLNDSTRPKLDDYHVRKAHYYGIFAGSFGVNYGADGLWQWAIPNRKLPGGIIVSRLSWDKALELKGSSQMQYLRGIMESLPWYRMKPFNGVVQDAKTLEPDGKTPKIVSMIRDDNQIAVFYAPNNPLFQVNIPSIPQNVAVSWYNPRIGTFVKTDTVTHSGTLTLQRPPTPSTPKDTLDWLVHIRAIAPSPSIIQPTAPLQTILMIQSTFPNPASFKDAVTISFIANRSNMEPAKITVIDVLGRVVFRDEIASVSQGANTYILSSTITSRFAQGLYSVVIQSGTEKASSFISYQH